MTGISNYKTLLDEVRHWNRKREPVCLVTFNYDTLIEESLRSVGISLQKIGDYVLGKGYNLIKLHGSINWGRRVEIPVLSPEGNAWAIASDLIEAGALLKLSDEFILVNRQPIASQDGMILFPALAIPVETKKSYECPQAHLDYLDDILPTVTKVLIVGWRGAEAHFLEMLCGRLQKSVQFSRRRVTESHSGDDRQAKSGWRVWEVQRCRERFHRLHR